MQTVIHIGWAWLILNEIVLVVFMLRPAHGEPLKCSSRTN